MFEIKNGCKLELKTPEIMKLFSSTRKINRNTKNGENVLRFDVVKVFLVQCNLVDNQCQQKSKLL